MGNKINPNILRLSKNKNWLSRWFSKKQYKILLTKDIQIRKLINLYLPSKLIYKLYIEIFKNYIIINIFSANKNLILEKYKNNIEKIKLQLRYYNNNNFIFIKDITRIQTLINKFIINIGNKLINNLNYKKELINIIKLTKNKIKGIKILISGRIKGLDIAKKENYNYGSIKNSSINNNISFHNKNIITKYGLIGIKIWINE